MSRIALPQSALKSPAEASFSDAAFQGGSESYWELLKPRVMSLVVFTAWVGMMLAPGSIHPFLGGIAILSIAVGAGASGASNMWYDRDIDAIMSRTQNRPIPSGRVSPQSALAFGIILSGASILVMGVFINWAAAMGLLGTIVFYALVYTMWLKRLTPQNIVIGGAAGAFPPVIGWLAVTGEMAWTPWILFLIIFLWTPPHFWALALQKSEDYTKAGVPMLPVVAGVKSTKRQMLIYTIALVAVTLLLPLGGRVGWLYTGGAGLLGVAYIGVTLYFFCRDDFHWPLKLFAFSIFYLFSLFGLMVLDLF